MIAVALLAFAAFLVVLAPRAAGAAWTLRAPRLAICAWQAASYAVVGALVLAGLTLLIPATALSGGLAEVLHACASTVAAVYGSPGELPGVALGALLAGAVPCRLLWVGAQTTARQRNARSDLRSSISLTAREDTALGVLVVDSARAAAFCLPGRRQAVVVTSAALTVLSETELAGVLAHERAHLRARHHVAVTSARVLTQAFPHLPLFARALAETERLVELLADDAAARDVHRVDIASALVNLAGMRAPSTALAAAQGSATALRISRLLEPEERMPLGRRVLVSGAVVLTLSGPVALAAWPLLSAIATGLCLMPDTAGPM